MIEILLVLGFPLLGALLLALWGHRTWAAAMNASMSLLTLLADEFPDRDPALLGSLNTVVSDHLFSVTAGC